MRFTTAVVVLGFLGSATSPPGSRQTPATGDSYVVGDRVVVVPPPRGYLDAAARFESARKSFSAEAGNLDLLAVFMTSEDVNAVSQGTPPALTMYATVKTIRPLKDRTFSPREFPAIFKAAMGTMTADPRLLEELSDRLGSTLSIGRPLNLGIVESTATTTSVLQLTRAAVGDATEIIATVSSLMLLNEKIVVITIFRKYANVSDLDTLRAFTTDWVDNIRRANMPGR
ncbi:MAG: hypothetical protein WD690_20145 [Vicinamibacterales bacterium]